MLNIHDFSQETVNSITEVIEKSAMQEKKKDSHKYLAWVQRILWGFFQGLFGFS